MDVRVIVAACACAFSAAWVAPADAAIVLRGTGVANTGTVNTVNSLAVPAPSGLAVDDVMIATVVSRSPSNTVTAAGWTAIGGANTASGLLVRQMSFYKVATSADVAAPSFTFDLGGATKAAAGIVAYSGVDTLTPIDGSAVSATGAAGTAPSAPAIPTTNLRARVLVLTGWASNSGVTADGATTERYESSSNVVTASNNATVEAADAVVAAPATVGPYAPTSASVAWTAQTVALNEMPELTASFPSTYTWSSLVPGTTQISTEQTVNVTSNRGWGLQLSSDRSDGRLRQWTGSAYGALSLTNPMQWRTSSIGGVAQGTSFAALSGTAATAATLRPASASAVDVGITFRQPVSYADEASLPAGNTYRQNVSYTAQQGF